MCGYFILIDFYNCFANFNAIRLVTSLFLNLTRSCLFILGYWSVSVGYIWKELKPSTKYGSQTHGPLVYAIVVC